EGTRLATEHLLGLGHRRIVVASVLRESRAPVFHEPGKARSLVAPITAMIERLAGVGDALSAAGLSLDTMPIVEACTVAEAEALGSGPAMILDRLGDATAVIALGDKLALAILAEARARGINVPRQLSVVGFDDFAPAAAAIPPLTTVNHDPVEAGRTAARLLLEGGPPQDVVMPVKLVVRASTAVRGPGVAPDRRSSQ
ncbi:MAG: substrate-binding domain-containing protein, partial [Bauldia sp.]